jgi:hypothetical protein
MGGGKNQRREQSTAVKIVFVTRIISEIALKKMWLPAAVSVVVVVECVWLCVAVCGCVWLCV